MPSLADVEESKQSNLTDAVGSKTPNKQALVSVAERTKYRWWIESPMSLISYGLNLSCIVTLPAAVMKNGGVAFLIPYCLLAILFGVSHYMMQLTLGQYSSQGAISVWHCVPIVKGVGIATVITTTIIAFYYSIVLAWTLEYIILSFNQATPWRSCVDPESRPQPWAIGQTHCLAMEAACTLDASFCTPQGFQPIIFGNYSYGIKNLQNDNWGPQTSNQLYLPAEIYFHKQFLELSNGIEQSGGIDGYNFLAYLAVMLLVSLLCIRGTRTLGKACVILCPIMIALGIAVLIRVCLEPGADKGLLLYVQPNWDSLGRLKTWGEAGVVAFFTVLPSWGAVTTIGSFNRFDYNMHRHAFFSVFVVLLLSLIFGLMVAAFAGVLVHSTSKSGDASWFIADGGSTIFVLAAQALSTFERPPSRLGHEWLIVFFLFVALLALTTLCWLTETIVVAIVDLVPKNRQITSFVGRKILIVALVVLGLAGTSRAGYFVVILVEGYTWKMTVMVYALVEMLFVSWAFGTEKLLAIITEMNGSKKFRFLWYALWRVIVPLLILLFLAYTWYTAIALYNWQFAQPYDEYIFPDWTMAIGYFIMLGPLFFIPLLAVFPFCKRSGSSFKDVLKALLKPDTKWHPEGQQAAGDGDGSTLVDAAELPLDSRKWAQTAALQMESVAQPEPQRAEIDLSKLGDRDAEKAEGAENNQDNNRSTISDAGSKAIAGPSEENQEKSRNRKKYRRRNRKEKEIPSTSDQEQNDVLPPIDRRVLRIHSSDDEMDVPPPLDAELRKPARLPTLADSLLDPLGAETRKPVKLPSLTELPPNPLGVEMKKPVKLPSLTNLPNRSA